MKKQMLMLVGVFMSCFLGACRPAHDVALQENLPLVSPSGVRIADSLEDLTEADFLTQRHGVGNAITVTKITYGWEHGAPPQDKAWAEKAGASVTLANIHYKTSKGEKGTYWMEVVRPKTKAM